MIAIQIVRHPEMSIILFFLPKISDLTDEKLIEICKMYEISHVLPTRDGELLFWAQRKLLLAQHNIQVWVSNEEHSVMQ